MRRMIMAVCGIVMMAGAAFAELKTGDDAPDFKLKTSDGKNIVSLETYKGKRIVYLNFFATWCANCKEEMETLKELNATYKSKGLTMIAVNVKESPGKVNKFISRFAIPFKVLLDEKADTARSYGLVGFPSNIIVDGEGKVRFIDSRPPANFDELFTELKSTLSTAAKP